MRSEARLFLPSLALSGLLCGNVLAQSTPTATATILSAGYSAPVPMIQGAPGQVVSITVSGLEYRLKTPVVAASTPLPKELAGLSVSLQQGFPQNAISAPLLGVQQSPCNLAPSPGLCPALTVLSVQIPSEVLPDCLLCLRPTIPAYLIISENGVPRTSTFLTLPADNIHITDVCDTTALLTRTPLEPCGKIVTHADGSRVNTNNPAKVGEQLVTYAFGLGRTEPLVPSGQATSTPPPQFPAGTFGLNFDLTPNAKPSRPDLSLRGGPPFTPTPVYAGLVPGFVGLYQINFVVPPAPAAIPYVACSGRVQSNLTVTLYGAFSFDGVGICVQPQ